MPHKQMDQMRTWCSLPHEILSLIVSRLLYGDIVAFHAVCKWWSETPSPITPSAGSFFYTEEFPFLLLPSNKLFHPIYKFFHRTRVYDLPYGAFLASHCGWLLMSVFEYAIFFFNPFTNEKIELPDMPFTHEWPNMTFTSPPTSPDCLVFGVEPEPIGNEKTINIYTIKPGQLYWTFHSFHFEPFFELSSCNPVMFKGLYYCLGNGGCLLIYDPATQEYEWVGPPEPPLYQNQSILGHQYYMVESQGELLLVFTDNEESSVNVVRYSTNKRIWEKVDNLGETLLFVSQVTSFSAKSVVRGTGNKIYFPKFVHNTDNQVFYSLATQKYHSFAGGRPWKNIERCSWNNIYETKPRSYANSTWIKLWNSS